MTPTNIRNIGILAHVDAGKTTLTEQMLYLSGAINKKGSVDKGTSHTDFLDIERQRGISIQSAHTSFIWNNIKINLIDTPGHTDFTSEVERILPALDGAILVISAAEGVQAHTESLWKALKDRQIPCLLFINKIDRIGVDINNVIKELRSELNITPIIMQHVTNSAQQEANILPLWKDCSEKERLSLMEPLAEEDEELLEAFMDEHAPEFNILDSKLKHQVISCHAQPIFFGCAKNSIGIKEILNGIVNYLPSPQGNIEESFSAVVYKIIHDNSLGKAAHVRIHNGSIKVRSDVYNPRIYKYEKVNLLRKANGNSWEETKILNAGDIGVIIGLNESIIGDVLGESNQNYYNSPINMPLFTTQVKNIEDKDYAALANALQILNSEDPRLEFEWLRNEKEFHLKIMGWMQIEILTHIIKSRFNIDVKFNDPSVIYKETPLTIGEGFEEYTMPKPCWAVVRLRIEPGERGSGVQYNSIVSTDRIKQKYQNEVERTINAALQQGIKGWEVTDIKITLIGDEDHEIHSRPGNFVLATHIAIMKGLSNTGTTLLEPIIAMTIKAPEEMLGKVAHDLTTMRGTFANPKISDGKFTLKALVPLATSMDYSIKLTSRSGGKARITSHFHNYQPIEDALGKTRKYIGINPLDRSKFILWKRKAITL